MRYYIADLHFCHTNLNQHMDRRGFKSGEAMNEHMIKQWNSRVRPGDEVVIWKYYEENGLHLLTIQGELCAPGIQQNRLKLARPEWYVFTIRIDGKRVGLKKMQEICGTLGLQMVPVEEIGTDLPSKYPTVEALLERADGEYPKGGKKEGIVIRPTEPVFNERISAALSMKVVSNKYLLKNEV